MKIIIYDNDKKFINGLRETVNFIEKKYDKVLRISLVSNIADKILEDAAKPKYDMPEPIVYFINPETDGTEDGIDLSKKLRKINSAFYFVFVSDEDFIRKTMDYEIRAFNYFYKPVGNGELTRLFECIERDFQTALDAYDNFENSTISVTTNYKKILIPLDTIIACEYKKPKTTIYTTKGNITGYFTLKDLQEKVDKVSKAKTFLKVHKAVSVNFKNAIEMDVSNSQIRTIGNLKFPIARGRKKEVYEIFNKSKIV